MDERAIKKMIALRKEAGLSQEEVADKIGVSRQAVSQWERAEVSPDTANWIALTALYDVTLDELVCNVPCDTPPERLSAKEKRQGMSPAMRRKYKLGIILSTVALIVVTLVVTLSVTLADRFTVRVISKLSLGMPIEKAVALLGADVCERIRRCRQLYLGSQVRGEVVEGIQRRTSRLFGR